MQAEFATRPKYEPNQLSLDCYCTQKRTTLDKVAFLKVPKLELIMSVGLNLQTKALISKK